MADKKQYELALKITGMVEQSLGNSAALTKRQIKSIAKEAAKANKSTVSFQEAMQKAGPGIDSAWGGLKTVAGAAAKAVGAASAVAAGAGIASIKTGKDFEKAMSSWAGTADATKEQYKMAQAAAMEMGRVTSKTATESANALEYMALAGWSVEDSVKGLPDVLHLSEATGLDLARTSDLVTDSMSATGTAVNDLTNYLDVAAMANNKSNQTAEMLMEAWIGVGGTMKGLHVPITDSATALGVLANRGIKGSEAGTALNAVMNNLTTGAGKAGKMMASLGLSAFDSDGKFIGLKETFQMVSDAVSGMTEEERNQTLAAIGGKQHIDALNALMSGLNTTLEDGSTEWEKLNFHLNHASGALDKMAKTKMDNLEGDLSIFNSALQDSGIRVYDGLVDPLRDGTQLATDIIYDFSDHVADRIKTWYPTIKRNAQEAGEGLAEFAGPFVNAGKWMVDNGDVVIGTLAGIATTITTLKLAKTLNDSASAMSGFVAAMASNPVTAAIGIAALAGGAMVGVAASMKIADEKAKRVNLARHFGGITLSMRELEEAAQEVIGRRDFEKITEIMDELDKSSGIAKKIDSASKSLEKLVWKAQMGYQLSDSDMSDFQSSVNTMIEQSLEMVRQKQYTAHLQVGALFGEKSEKGGQLIESLDALYSGLSEDVSAAGKELGDLYSAALEDGIIDVDEASAINKLQLKISNITNGVERARSEARWNVLTGQASGANLDSETFQNLQRQANEYAEQMKEGNQSNAIELQTMVNWRLQRGEISQEDAEQQIQDIQDQLSQKNIEVDARLLQFNSDSIKQAYAKEFDDLSTTIAEDGSAAMQEAMNRVQEYAERYAHSNYNPYNKDSDLADMLGINDIDKSTKNAVGDLLANISPQIEEMKAKRKEFEEAGKEIPQGLADALSDVTVLEAISGKRDAMYELLNDQAAVEAAAESAKTNGEKLPQGVASGIEAATPYSMQAIETLRRESEEKLRTEFNRKFTVNPVLDMQFTASQQGLPAGIGAAPVKRALGGLVTQPTFIAGEGGDDEMVIPINSTVRAGDLYRETGRLLASAGNSVGGSETNNSSSNIVYSPKIYVSGNADGGSIKQALAEGYEQFKSYMAQYCDDERRLSYVR